MKILILGSTGRTGKLLLSEAINAGYDIHVLVRNKSRLPVLPVTVTVFEGTPANSDELLSAMKGCGAILSALNISRTSDFPWAPLRTPPDFLSVSTDNILAATCSLNIKRIIVTSAWGTNETKKDIPFWFRWLIDYSNIGYAYRDHERAEDLLKQSGLNYTIVRPVGLTNSLNKKEILVSINNSPKPYLTISRQNVARFMIKVLKENLCNNESPVISDQ